MIALVWLTGEDKVWVNWYPSEACLMFAATRLAPDLPQRRPESLAGAIRVMTAHCPSHYVIRTTQDVELFAMAARNLSARYPRMTDVVELLRLHEWPSGADDNAMQDAVDEIIDHATKKGAPAAWEPVVALLRGAPRLFLAAKEVLRHSIRTQDEFLLQDDVSELKAAIESISSEVPATS